MVSGKAQQDEGADFFRCGSFTSMLPGKTRTLNYPIQQCVNYPQGGAENNVKLWLASSCSLSSGCLSLERSLWVMDRELHQLPINRAQGTGLFMGGQWPVPRDWLSTRNSAGGRLVIFSIGWHWLLILKEKLVLLETGERAAVLRDKFNRKNQSGMCTDRIHI